MKDTKTAILDTAERLTQTRGFNGFSYIDLSEEVGVKTSSIHYHFKSKADLGVALVERTYANHMAAFESLDAQYARPQQRLSALIAVFQDYAENQKLCLCGMLSAELQSVSPAVREGLSAYFRAVRAWIASQYKAMGFKDAKNRALSFTSVLEGSLLIARIDGDPELVGLAMKTAKRE